MSYVPIIKRLYLLLFILGCITSLEGKDFAFPREFDSSPPAFEKVYLYDGQVLSMYDGTYIKHGDGTIEKVRAVMQDYCGSYYLRVVTQCPLCGRCYSGRCSGEGMCCPLYEKEICPGIWK